ncbi:hypothetical protein SPRG_20114 [Saprolegnia parasitica CBS 223.65]|uniref:Major facilitator superfamily (MFS) profile domain-containing protein n=1 Tax=Saprolegnia parasitica (strain CBS 223.65) TaxID=695850 RepID=A0A067CES2_SAPPC|nr:hypothetical protein SPRG_20114 [Saprolegnia parasitica CBS 223.65]KDO29008.1 hypothetical protein SPRG_20114 [Saprolegnia parasitica CBS 223.65]|eukprot:XP_012200337.1 hypothetical protein SPRG_20114 [Saprolegnia parasitica CBS 223.65]
MASTPTDAYVPAPATPTTVQPKPDVYLPMKSSPKAKTDDLKRTGSTGSLRASRRSTSRVRLSRLEAMLPDETAAALMPTSALYITAAVALIGCLQVGWCLVQLNYRPFNLDPVISLLSTAIYVGAFSLSIGPMAWMLTAEIFPDFLHAKAGGIGTMTTWIADLIVGLFYPSIAATNALSNYAFLLFFAFLVGYASFTYVMLPETSHKTSDEIQLLFNPLPVMSPKAQVELDPYASID